MSIHGVLTGGVKRSSGVNVLEDVIAAWAEVRDDSNEDVNWVIAGYKEGSKKDIIVIDKGSGGLDSCSKALPENSKVAFGGVKLLKTGRFVSFFYCPEDGVSAMARGRASLHKNGVLNTLEGCDCEIEITPGITEETVVLPKAIVKK